MTFANMCVDRDKLLLLTQLLLSSFPGCTIHQSRDPMRTAQHLSTRKVDAVFADADTYSDLERMLPKQKSETSVYLLCRQDLQMPEKTDGIRGIISYPITKQKLRSALQIAPREIKEVI